MRLDTVQTLLEQILRKKHFPLVFLKEKNDGNRSGCLACSLAIPSATSNAQFFLVVLYIAEVLSAHLKKCLSLASKI